MLPLTECSVESWNSGRLKVPLGYCVGTCLHHKWYPIPYYIKCTSLSRAHRAMVKSTALCREQGAIWDETLLFSVEEGGYSKNKRDTWLPLPLHTIVS